jgi:hypothetical protein
MFESNFPKQALLSYTVLWNQFKKLTKSFPHERAAMLHDTATRLPPPGDGLKPARAHSRAPHASIAIATISRYGRISVVTRSITGSAKPVHLHRRPLPVRRGSAGGSVQRG